MLHNKADAINAENHTPFTHIQSSTDLAQSSEFKKHKLSTFASTA